MSDDDTRYIGILLEEIRDQNKAVLEAVGDMQQQVALMPAMRDGITELKQDMKVVKAATTDLNSDVHNLERRVARLEAA